MIQEFNDLPWHDAELKEIIINRVQKDDIRIIVCWPEDYESRHVCIEFFNCYAFQADMHFGIVPPDFILEAECITRSQELDSMKDSLASMNLEVPGLRCYRITTNSTNSVLNIFALGFRVIVME